tara:strand:+ start:101 stop:475 length:375 start_codon:yes stop_codon:yes gene_type:complete
MSSRKIQCVISGKSYNFAKDYFQKKVEEYDDEDNLKKYFITRKVKTLLNKGYSVNEVRNILGVSDEEELADQDSDEVKDMIEFHRVRNTGKNKRVSNTLNFATLKSDPDVAAFINTISNYDVPQ